MPFSICLCVPLSGLSSRYWSRTVRRSRAALYLQDRPKLNLRNGPRSTRRPTSPFSFRLPLPDGGEVRITLIALERHRRHRRHLRLLRQRVHDVLQAHQVYELGVAGVGYEVHLRRRRLRGRDLWGGENGNVAPGGSARECYLQERFFKLFAERQLCSCLSLCRSLAVFAIPILKAIFIGPWISDGAALDNQLQDATRFSFVQDSSTAKGGGGVCAETSRATTRSKGNNITEAGVSAGITTSTVGHSIPMHDLQSRESGFWPYEPKIPGSVLIS